MPVKNEDGQGKKGRGDFLLVSDTDGRHLSGADFSSSPGPVDRT